MDPAIRNISFKIMWTGAMFYTACRLKNHRRSIPCPDFRYFWRIRCTIRHRNRRGRSIPTIFFESQSAITEYNNLKSLPWSDLTAFADNFTGIKVTSDKDWSAEYPAGSPLNDKMGVRYVSYAEYIENDYHSYSDLGKEILFLYNKPLSTLQSDDLRVIEYTPSSLSIYSFILYFTSVPDNPGEEHTFTVEFITSDGTVKTASITCTPEVDPALQ